MLDLFTIALSIFVQAIPFLAIGTLVSTFISPALAPKLLHLTQKLPRIFSYPIISLYGLTLPVCECGNIPVTRNLIQSGYKPSQAITFMLAAPIINPITLFTTYDAFRTTPEIFYYRLLAGLTLPVIIGLLFEFKQNQSRLLAPQLLHLCQHPHSQPKTQTFFQEFSHMLFLLLPAVFVASAFQVFFPSTLLQNLTNSPTQSITFAMALAAILSVCSSVDAYIGLSLLGSFSIGAVSAFLIYGPMVDIKLLLMMRTTFSPFTLFFIFIYTTLSTFLTGLLIHLF